MITQELMRQDLKIIIKLLEIRQDFIEEKGVNEERCQS